MRHPLAYCAVLLILCTSVHAQDVADKTWNFTTPGDFQGWTLSNFTSSSVDNQALTAITGANTPQMTSASGIAVAASLKHYVEIRMRQRFNDSPTNRYGSTEAQIYFTTEANQSFNETNKIRFLAFGNGEWKTYKIYTGSLTGWTGTVRQLRVIPCSTNNFTQLNNARVEISHIKIVKDNTPPKFSVHSIWTYQDGDSTSDNTPTISLKSAYDEVSGLGTATFHRKAAGAPDASYAYDGQDVNPNDGIQRRYSALSNGSYDLGVRLTDKAGNFADWTTTADAVISNLTINASLPTTITVNAGQIGKTVNKLLFGNNIHWTEFGDVYDPVTNSLPATLEENIDKMGLTVLRYPGGCYADTFYWKHTIGPVNSRPNMNVNTCSPQLENRGKVKFGIDEFVRWCKARNIEPMITCRFRWPGAAGIRGPYMDGNDPYNQALQDAADLVEYLNAPNNGSNPNGGTDWAAIRAANGHPAPYGVKFFEVGNEPFGVDPFGSPTKIGLDATAYTVPFLKYQELMKTVDASVSVMPVAFLIDQRAQGNDFLNRYTTSGAGANGPSWAYRTYSSVGPFLNEAQYHPYFPYSTQSNEAALYPETMAAPKAFDDALASQRIAQKVTIPGLQDPIKLHLTEWNINFFWGSDNIKYTGTLMSAIALADSVRVFFENDDIIASAQWWLMYGNSSYNTLSSNNVDVFPPFHVFRVYKNHFGEKLVPSKVVASPTFDYVKVSGSFLDDTYDIASLTSNASISADGNTLYLIVVNKNKDSDLTSTVDLNDFAAFASQRLSAEVWTLDGTDVFDFNQTENVRITEDNSEFMRTFSYTFPKHSVTSFKFTRINGTAPGVSIGSPSVNQTSAGPVSFPVTYTNAVSISLAPSDVLLNTTGTASANVSISGSGTVSRTVTLTGLTGTGTIGISLKPGTALSNDGIAGAAGPSSTLVVDNSAPTAMIVSDQGEGTPETDRLEFTWTPSQDPQTGVQSYSYSIGTAPGLTDVVSWTSNGLGTTVEITDLNLAVGQTYYASVKATNSVGLQTISVSDGIKVVALDSKIGISRQRPNGQLFGLDSKIVTHITHSSIWIEEQDRSAATRVDTPFSLVDVGDVVTLAGRWTIDGPERVIDADVVTKIGSGDAPTPVKMNIRTLIGQGYNASTPGLPGGVGLYNAGMLVTVVGKVISAETEVFGNYSMLLDDGSNMYYGANQHLFVRTDMVLPPSDGFAKVTGILTMKGSGDDVRPVIILRSSDDIEEISVAPPPQLSIGAPSISQTNSGPVTFLVTYLGAETVSLNAAMVSLNKTGAANATVEVMGSGNLTRTVRLSGITGNGTLGISIAAGSAASTGGPASSAGPSLTVQVDNTAPTITLSAPSATVTRGGPVTYTVTYNGATTVGLNASMVTLNKTGTANGSISISGSGNTTRQISITSITGDGTLGITIAAGSATDQVGNPAPTSGNSNSFLVDNTAPTTVTVTDGGAITTSLTQLNASWTASSDGSGSGLLRYDYAVGLTPTSQDVLGWTSAGLQTSVVIQNLSLIPGITYYIQVRAVDKVGLMSNAASSDGIKVQGGLERIGQAWALSNGQLFTLSDKLVTYSVAGSFWIQEDDRSAALKVNSLIPVIIGSKVTVAGTLGYTSGQRVMNATVVVGSPGLTGSATPLNLTLRNIGGASFNALTPGVEGAFGLYNVGMLVRTTGRVTGTGGGIGNRYFYLDDGTGGLMLNNGPFMGVKVMTGTTLQPIVGSFVTVTGLVEVDNQGGVNSPVVITRSASDILVVD